MILLLTKIVPFQGENPAFTYQAILTGEVRTEEAAKDFIINKFFSLNDDPSRKVFVFCTDATDMNDFGPIMRKIMRIAVGRSEGE